MALPRTSTGEPSTVPARVLRLAPEPRAEIERSAREAYPSEVCGVLLGRRVGDGIAVEEVARARNLRVGAAPGGESARSFELDPGALVAAEDRARTLGLEIVGIWHSHPDAPAIPSEEDRRSAWRGWCHLIVAVDRNSITDVRAWLLDRGEIPIVSAPSAEAARSISSFRLA